jgi:hypothetical protein
MNESIVEIRAEIFFMGLLYFLIKILFDFFYPKIIFMETNLDEKD